MPRYDTPSDLPPSTDLYISEVIARVPQCSKHPGTEDNQPCWYIRADRGGVLIYSVCNHRAIKAGYVGVITEAPKARTPQLSRA